MTLSKNKYSGGLKMSLVVKSKVKDLVKKKKMNMGADALGALDKEIARLIDRAAQRAKDNRRSTVKGRDI